MLTAWQCGWQSHRAVALVSSVTISARTGTGDVWLQGSAIILQSVVESTRAGGKYLMRIHCLKVRVSDWLSCCMEKEEETNVLFSCFVKLVPTHLFWCFCWTWLIPSPCLPSSFPSPSVFFLPLLYASPAPLSDCVSYFSWYKVWRQPLKPEGLSEAILVPRANTTVSQSHTQTGHRQRGDIRQKDRAI